MLFGRTLHSQPKTVEDLAAAVRLDLDGPGKIQAQHAHEALGIDLLVIISHHDLKGLHGGQRNKILHFCKRMKTESALNLS